MKNLVKEILTIFKYIYLNLLHKWQEHKPTIIDKLDKLERAHLKWNKLIWLPIAVCLLLFILSLGGQNKTNAIDGVDLFEWKLQEERLVIGCYNSYTKTARAIFNTEETGCYKNWDHNIMVMPEAHLPIWRTLWNDREIINRMPIVNFESGYDVNASNAHARWYVQTLRSYNIDINIKPQLQWMYNRQQVQKLEYTKWGSPRCGIYWSQYNYKDGFNAWEEGVMACLYRYHYHAHNGVWYSNKAMEARKVYFAYFNIK